MRHLHRIVCCVALSMTVAAQESDRTGEAADRLERALEHESGLSEETRAALREFVETLRADRTRAAETRWSKGDVARAVDEYLAASRPAGEQPSWERVLEQLAVYGDLRLRYEASFNQPGTRDRHRLRTRLRLGADYRWSDDVLVGARIVTGNSDDPNSPHQTLGSAFDSFEISLDRLFLTYTPEQIAGGSVTAGKFHHPFQRNPVYGELVWDSDVQPEGVLAAYTRSGTGTVQMLRFQLGGYTVLEGAADDVFALAAEAAGRFRWGEQAGATLSAAYYLYSDPTPDGSTTLLGDNAGNATADTDGDGAADRFLSDFGILDLTLGFEYAGWRHPLTLGAEYMRNTEAGNGRDQGWSFGAALGKAREKGEWRFYYQWQVVQQEAVFSAFAQDDFLFQTNHRSHVLGANYRVTKGLDLHLWALVSRPDAGDDEDRWRVRLDLNLKF